MFNKLFSILFVLAVVGSGFYFYFLFPYDVTIDLPTVEKALEKRINDTEEVKKYLSLKQFERIEKTDTYVAVFVLSNDEYFRKDKHVGVSVLQKGINGKLTISTSNYGTKDIHYERAETDKGVFVVFAGVKKDDAIQNIDASFPSLKKPISLPLTEEDFFVVYTKVSDTFSETRYPKISLR